MKKIRETRDCISNFAQKATSAGLVERSELEQIDDNVMALIDASVAQAKADTKPAAEDLLTDVYVSY